MAHQPYDRSGKSLLQHHGGALLKIGGVERIRSWRAAQAEVIQASYGVIARCGIAGTGAFRLRA